MVAEILKLTGRDCPMEQEEPFQAEGAEERAISWDHDGLEYSELLLPFKVKIT